MIGLKKQTVILVWSPFLDRKRGEVMANDGQYFDYLVIHFVMETNAYVVQKIDVINRNTYLAPYLCLETGCDAVKTSWSFCCLTYFAGHCSLLDVFSLRTEHAFIARCILPWFELCRQNIFLWTRVQHRMQTVIFESRDDCVWKFHVDILKDWNISTFQHRCSSALKFYLSVGVVFDLRFY